MIGHLSKKSVVVFSVIILIIILFAGISAYKWRGSSFVYEEVILDSEIDIYVNTVRVSRGGVYLNDKYAISTAWRKDCKTNMEIRSQGIKDFSPPYRLIKPKGSLFYIIRHDTLCFELPSNDRFTAPTFKDLFGTLN